MYAVFALSTTLIKAWDECDSKIKMAAHLVTTRQVSILKMKKRCLFYAILTIRYNGSYNKRMFLVSEKFAAVMKCRNDESLRSEHVLTVFFTKGSQSCFFFLDGGLNRWKPY